MKNAYTNKTIVFIESNTTGTGELFLQKAIEKELTPIFITANPDKYPFLQANLFAPVVMDTQNRDELLKYLSQYSNLVGVFSTSEYYIKLASYLANQLGLPGNIAESVANCRDKFELSLLLRERGIPHAKTWKINQADDQEAILKTIDRLPVIVKPVKGSGSSGVRLCHTLSEVATYTEQAILPILIQEFIEGNEYSVETLGINGEIHVIGITKKYLGELPYFVETGHDYPHRTEEGLADEVAAVVTRTLNELRLTFGPVHTEIKIYNGKVYIIEINPRLAGGMIPELIRMAQGIDLIDISIDLVTGQKVSVPCAEQGFASIRFMIPQHMGHFGSVELEIGIKQQLAVFKVTKDAGSLIALKGDFSDRVGFLIATANDLKACQALADQAIGATTILMLDAKQQVDDNLADTGRIKQLLMPEARAILNGRKPFTLKEEFKLIAEIDIAHLTMLYQTQLIDKQTFVLVVNKINQFKAEGFASLINEEMPRGSYLLYEDALVRALGIKVAGVIHTGRSRNDINATIFYLKLKRDFATIYRQLWRLRATLLNQAKQHDRTPLPLYSQYQTAMPGILAHYLLGFENALSREQTALQSLYPMLDRCPMGAGSCGGTTLAINPEITAHLLGFSQPTENSLDAIASRDVAIRLLCHLGSLAVTLSRLTEDLQLWSTQEFGFIDFPEALTGGSSMMPQKKNPYLLEKIKGRLAMIPGGIVAAMGATSKVPFANSVEIGTESLRGLETAFDDFGVAIELLELIMRNIGVNETKTNAAIMDHVTYATYLSDQLVKAKYCTVKEAHHLIGSTIRKATETNEDILEAMQPVLEQLNLKMLSPLAIADAMEYGGGPGRRSIEKQYQSASLRLNQDGLWWQKLQIKGKRAYLREDGICNLANMEVGQESYFFL